MTAELVAPGDVPDVYLGLLALSVRSAMRGGTIRLTVADGERLGQIAVDVEQARHFLGLPSRYRPPADEETPR